MKEKSEENELCELEKDILSNEYANNIIKIIKSLEDLGVPIDAVTVTVKREIKKQEGGFLGVLVARLTPSIVQPVISSGMGVRRTGKRAGSSTPSFKQYQGY